MKNIVISLLSVCNLILISILIVKYYQDPDTKVDNVRNQKTKYVPAKSTKPKMTWEKAYEFDVFGEATDEAYYKYKFNMKLPTGILGGNLDAIFKIKERKDAVWNGNNAEFDNFDYTIVISPDTLNMPKCSYGESLYLWYKEDECKASDDLIRFYWSEDGYHLCEQTGRIIELRELFLRWVVQHKNVKFKGFTTDGAGAKKFYPSPDGIKGPVFINPEFSIQF